MPAPPPRRLAHPLGWMLLAAPLCGAWAAPGIDYAAARRQAEDLVELARRMEARIVAAVSRRFEAPEVDVEVLPGKEVRVMCRVRTREMSYPDVQASLKTLAQVLNTEVLGRYYRDHHLSPSSALVVLNRREGDLPGDEAAPEPPDAAPRTSRARDPDEGLPAMAAAPPGPDGAGRLRRVLERLRGRRHQPPDGPAPPEPPGTQADLADLDAAVAMAPISLARVPARLAPLRHGPPAPTPPDRPGLPPEAAPGQVLPGAAGVGLATSRAASRAASESSVRSLRGGVLRLLDALDAIDQGAGAAADQPGSPPRGHPLPGTSDQVAFLLGPRLARLGTDASLSPEAPLPLPPREAAFLEEHPELRELRRSRHRDWTSLTRDPAPPRPRPAAPAPRRAAPRPPAPPQRHLRELFADVFDSGRQPAARSLALPPLETVPLPPRGEFAEADLERLDEFGAGPAPAPAPASELEFSAASLAAIDWDPGL